MSEGTDIVGDTTPEPEHQSLPVKSFKPWHRPRKQWVREQQWKQGIIELIDSLNLNGRPLAYLSLPGDDLLDVRVVHDVCLLKNVKLKFLGFNDVDSDDAATELSISLSEVKSLPLVDGTSDVLVSRLESIANVDSVGHRQMQDFGMIDVVNIDLCDSIAKREFWERGGATYFKVLMELIKYQVSNRTLPWLFFLTTRCAPENMHTSYVSLLSECIKVNLEHPEFCTIMADLFGLDVFDETALASIQEQLEFPVFMQTFCIGFGKWLLQTMATGIPRSAVEMLPSYYYKVHRPGDMISMAYRFDPIIKPPRDLAGLTQESIPATQNALVSEAELAIKIVQQTGRLVDIDQLLVDNPEHLEQMIANTETLLRNARYPVDGYKSWLFPTR